LKGKDLRDVAVWTSARLIAYYNLPRGKWSALIKYMLQWRKRADRLKN